ncbi:protein SET DOMAIN GROUP 41 isoform X1 [Punica granatum]|uniref:Protein SET DOMAIN GROUP 41 isoform X1 n=1 Tax=Punica granatum TaxID=22663 RepID=A0A6P8DEP1_PUNGR|nr:protein SET DOMAIN GROUP 41 isoform X1 [Punica granatum]XP_031395025.1 protein SET DOMAIN GROUP 41 isoform X1 [Punica granatum]XP_031395026.1 protein SET DOMAIN GROUP 41 isoform X1 [Punica granatum]XP_031395027.1 protein SET DOMAIN GROUP 41 isoform X1 [Punica granatum]XP_031395028.1 protein SET DOMAIN GROUP 41 isoform X1 [Punica granatum]
MEPTHASRLMPEMEMRAIDDVIEMGRQLTPALPPLSHALHDSFLHSHCSACFSPLHPPPPPSRVLYCSQACSASDSPLHTSSAELQLLLHRQSPSSAASDDGDTSDVRAALRLLAALRDAPSCCGSQRIAGLLTNRDTLLAPETATSGILATIQSGAKAMAAARSSQKGSSDVSEDMKATTLEEAALCAVLTNAVEVQDSEGRGIGIAIYGTDFSWINHSCSPNACYRFQFQSALDTGTLQSLRASRMWISPSGCDVKMDNGAIGFSGLRKGYAEYGPRIMVRSIKPIKKGMEVTIAYTDLLQPKAARQSELRSKYEFICQCTRCCAEPPIYVDRILQNFHAVSGDFPLERDGISFNQDEAIERLTDGINDAVADYLSAGDAESCCLKLEELLTVRVLDEGLKTDTRKIALRNHCLQLHPLHYLSIEAHTILASAYKVRGSRLAPPSTGVDRVTWEDYDLTRISAAYSLLLAGAVHHLFCSESSLICSAANFWANAGESLLKLARSLAWDENYKTCMCSLVNQSEAYYHLSHPSYADFERISNHFRNCVTHHVREVWDFLRHGCPYLRGIRDPIDFSWLGTNLDSCLGIVRNVSRHELLGQTAEGRPMVFQLGVHCALYGNFLLSICYGEGSRSTSHIQGILRSEETL